VRSTASSSTTSFADPKTIARYFLVGGTCAGVDLAIFLLLAQHFGLPYMRVAAGSFVIATLMNYFLSVRFVFVSGVRFRRRWEIAMVFAVSAVGLVLNQLILFACIEVAHLNLLFSKLAATGTVFFWNYFARRAFIFGATHA
jgi:putative flippase GtrA